jgi:hypothetical protein
MGYRIERTIAVVAADKRKIKCVFLMASDRLEIIINFSAPRFGCP